jgi:hypothetical protein
MPTREQLSAMLQEFVRHMVITEVEKNQFFEALAQRYLGARSSLDMKLDQLTAAKEEIIINYLEQCEDNDVLADLHGYLGGKKFDDLRVHDEDLLKWVGTNAKGSVISTSQTWARIEKCISLKMAMNYCEQTKFNADIGKRAASQFADTHSFFAIKRKAGRGQKQNNVVTDLANGNRDSLVNRYRKNFC